jgi:DNA-binding YbaB/EbfC family protein
VFEGLTNVASLMRHAQRVRGMMDEINQRLRRERVKGAAAGGMIEVEANGLGEVLRVVIEPALVEKGEREMIEDLLPAAINAALVKAKEAHSTALAEMTQGLNLPGLDSLLSQFRGEGNGPR